MAVGFNNYTSKATIYQYKLWEVGSEKEWRPTNIPETRAGFIPSLWGIWGYNESGTNNYG